MVTACNAHELTETLPYSVCIMIKSNGCRKELTLQATQYLITIPLVMAYATPKSAVTG